MERAKRQAIRNGCELNEMLMRMRKDKFEIKEKEKKKNEEIENERINRKKHFKLKR